MAQNGEDKVIAVAKHIAKTLGRTETMTDDILQIFSTIDRRFSREKMSEKSDDEGSFSCLERSLRALDQRLARWGIGGGSDFAAERSVWSDSGEAAMFLDAVDELVAMFQEWEPLGGDKTVAVALDRTEILLQQAMFKLEEEFRSLIERNSEAVDPGWLFEPSSSSNNGGDTSKFFDSDEGEEDEESEEKIPVAEPVTDYNFVIDMLPAGTVSDLHEIAKRMIAAGFAKECSHVYSSLRREFLDESISRLGIEKLSIEDVQKMAWPDLEEAIQKWIQALKVSLHIFFPSERRLCNRVFSGLSSVSDLSFMEVCRGATIQLLNFADAVTIGSRAPERLFRLLDIYETLRDLLPEFNSVFSGTYCSFLCSEATIICKRSGEAIRGVLMELENLIQRDPAKAAVPGGGVHPITRYVMNYMKAACGSRQTLEQVFSETETQDTNAHLNPNPPSSSPFSIQTAWIMELLETNLESKSKTYRDLALSSVFLMNNGRYIVQKVKDSELGFMLGDDWIRKHTAKVRQCHTNYQRCSWGKVLGCLKLEGMSSSHGGSHVPSGVVRAVKERFKAFNVYFEEMHRAQTGWVVADDQLRTELRISVAEFLLPAYRSFVGRFQHVVEAGKHADKYMKYSPEDLESLINELFQGSPGSFGGRQ